LLTNMLMRHLIFLIALRANPRQPDL